MKRLILLLSILLLVWSWALAEEPVQTEGVYRTLSVGDRGEDVRALQTHLALLGYYTGSITGRYGENTASAFRQFEKDLDLDETDTVSPQLQALLYETEYRPVYLGISGQDVSRMQTRLMQLGYYTGRISGTYLEGTLEAISAFQEKMGRIPTGFADVQTLELLFSTEAIARSGAAVVTPKPEQDGVILDGNKEETATDEVAVPFVKKTAYGASGKYVRQIQTRLQELGYYTGRISGSFQGNTRNAVKAFQRQNGLSDDGVVGEQTWNMLFNTEEIAGPDDEPKPAITPAPTTFHIVVDVTNQAVTVYGRGAEGEYDVVIRQMICSTGTRENPSDIGDFVLSGRKARWCYFPKWGDYAQYWTKINGGIAFHSVIYREVNTQSLSVKSYNKLGSRASHGCIRLQVADAKWIYDNVGAGTVVTITESLPADAELRHSLVKPSLNRGNMLPVSTPQPTFEPVYIPGAQPPLPLKALGKNDSGEDVWWLQKKLTELSYYTGTCSGTYLDGTAKAVAAFQADHGLSSTGRADLKTLNALYAQELATIPPAPSATPAPVASASDLGIVEEGSTEDPVLLLDALPEGLPELVPEEQAAGQE